jgi:cell division protein FtsW
MFQKIDLLLLGVTVVLAFFGLAMVASVSVFDSYQITETNSFYLIRSSAHIILGLSAMFVCMLVPYRTWGSLALPLFSVTLLLLIAVFVPSIGVGDEAGYTARGWLIIGGWSFQPSELLKLTLIFYLAVWMQRREALIGTFKDGFIPFVVLICLSTLLVAIQPDLGSFLVLSVIAITMFFTAGGNILHIITGGSISAALGLPIILNKPYVLNRFAGFFQIILSNQPIGENTVCSTKAGYQVCQALIAIGSGGFFGLGYGKSIQKFGYLPEVQSDTIFAAMAEELGFMRLMIILALYAVFCWRGYKIALEAPDRFGFLVAVGITTWIGFQTILNIAVNIGLFPITGLTLPFISYGGSSMLMLLSAVGILLNISYYSSENTAVKRRERRKSLLFFDW